MAVTCIVNPRAGGGRAPRVLAELERRQREIGQALGEPIAIRITMLPGHGEVLAREAAHAGSRIVVAAGGDGLIHEVVNGLQDSQVTLGIVPAGSGNDIVRALGIPMSPGRAVDVLCRGSVRQIDLGRIGNRSFVGFAGTGLDAFSVSLARQSRAPLKGMPLYVWGLLRALRRYRPLRMALDAEGRQISGHGWILVASNTPNFGGGMVIAPEARLDDGLLDMNVLLDVSRLEFLSLFFRVLIKRPISDPRLKRFRATSAVITGDGALLVQADGEIHGRLPAEIRVLPRALSVIAPG